MRISRTMKVKAYSRMPLGMSGKAPLMPPLKHKHVDAHIKDVNSQTPLSYAVERGNVEVVKLLLEREDIGVNVKDSKGRWR